MKILFLHPNMPGQYKHLCKAFAEDPANEVVFITKPRKNVQVSGVRKIEYAVARDASPHTHRYLIGTERAVLAGQEVWRVCRKLKQEGFVPDVAVGHPGWGDMLYLKDIYPDVPMLGYYEFFYHATGADVGFDPEDPATEDDKARVRTKNITNLLNLHHCDWGISPMKWQRDVHPPIYHDRISVIHDGIDTDAVKPNPNIKLKLAQAGERSFTKQDEIITYVARNFEPYRGFPTFMRAAKLICERRPNAQIVVVGADDVSYGKRPQGGKTYRQIWLEKVPLDLTRVHFVGSQPYDVFLQILQLSSAHIYLTYPFVLSWSMLESMAAGCLVIGSNTAPVTEVIEDGKNGLLTDFFSPEMLADRIDEVFAHRDRMQAIREAARQTVIERYDLKKLLPLHMDLVRDVANRQFPPPTHARIRQETGQ